MGGIFPFTEPYGVSFPLAGLAARSSWLNFWSEVSVVVVLASLLRVAWYVAGVGRERV